MEKRPVYMRQRRPVYSPGVQAGLGHMARYGPPAARRGGGGGEEDVGLVGEAIREWWRTKVEPALQPVGAWFGTQAQRVQQAGQDALRRIAEAGRGFDLIAPTGVGRFPEREATRALEQTDIRPGLNQLESQPGVRSPELDRLIALLRLLTGR